MDENNQMKINEKELMVGDWIQFQRNGKTVIDEVMHIAKDRFYPYNNVAYTPHYGSVDSASIIKVKREEL